MMTAGERKQLLRHAGSRARHAKAEAVEREKILLSEVEDLLAAEFQAQDDMWADAVRIAEEAAAKANDLIAARCLDLGIPGKYAPELALGFHVRSPSLADSSRRAELRRLAQSRLTALTATAKRMIDGKLLDVETELLSGSLESAEAAAFLSAMPTVDQLMPSLSLDDLGVTHWQPPESAAAELVSPTTTAGRKRRQVLRAIEANPDASDRALAALAGVDHKTVAAYRRRGGEIPASGGEFPGEVEA